MTPVDRTIDQAEKQRELLAATLRVFVFFALLAAVLSLREHGAHHHPVLKVTIAYGVLTFAGLVFAWRRIFHPILPAVFITLEVGLVSTQTVLMGQMMGQSAMSLSALPVATVIFVILAHAAMRYRPWLVIYAAGLFLFVLTAAGNFMPYTQPEQGVSHNRQHDMVHHQIFPAVMIVLSAAILFVTARETRRLLLVSISERMARHRLSRFFAPDIASRLTTHSGDDGTPGAVQPVAVLFADIREFSPLAEDMSPSELTEFLGEFREIVAQIIQEHGGVVDKFIGDAVMAVFGFPTPGADSASRCLSCAYAMLEQTKAWSETRITNGQRAIRIGIGIHYGEAFVGVVGREQLLEFTVIGDTVNIAERVERLTRTFTADIAVSRDFADAADLDPVPSGWRSAPAQPISGHSRPVDIFYLHRVGDRVGAP